MATLRTCDFCGGDGPFQNGDAVDKLATAFPSSFEVERKDRNGEIEESAKDDCCMKCWHELNIVVEKWAKGKRGK